MLEKIQYISQGDSPEQQLANISKALDAGCKWIQLRYKNKAIEEVQTLAKMVQKICRAYDATFIINDHVQVASEINADGVHLGLDDISVMEARILLKDKIIGGTANSLKDVLQRVNEKCDYIGLGPFRFTTTKEKLSPVLGIEGYQEILKEVKNRNIDIPIYAIGGIEIEDVEKLEQAGVYGVAVSGLITHHKNPEILFKPKEICNH
ncbi:thiamine phosphate synthase [Flavobacterium sp. F372]|uniref:Thiamine-phosphate synthase n=1 Tax=Flavobacterium bernardetii TaxID=2813823 RepID=A0ABR7IUZ2_9FLAO|nr:thiamine phosphate synthase [Flavobacterium bernardetii]MBC5833479.1 thiamine phosphate synthase [Flavobacterium bernardetii]NHF68711.1 thiamine phosphate synthase [Flavobacterium bernardetii]